VDDADMGMYRCVVSTATECDTISGEAELTIAPQAATWHSVKTHDDEEIEMELDAGQGVVTESRRGDLVIRIVFDKEVLAADGTINSDDVSVTDSQEASYTPSSVELVDEQGDPATQSNTLEITLDASQIDKKALTVELVENKLCRPSSEKAMLLGDRDCEVHCRIGDVAGGPSGGDGFVGLGDVSAIKYYNRQNVSGSNARFDVNADGNINIIDMALTMSKLDP
jgi:hypothetical protein